MKKFKLFVESLKKIEYFNNDFLKRLFLDDDFQDSYYHQAIMNICYEDWDLKLKDKRYTEFIDYVADTYGDFVAFCVLVGKYNQQVCNGGHTQYHYNHYDGSSSTDRNEEYIPLHDMLVNLFSDFDINKEIKNGKEFYDILGDYFIELDNDMDEETCGECGGDGEVCDGDDCETCDECGGSGYVEVQKENNLNTEYLSRLDDKYYEINDVFMDDFNRYLKDIFCSFELQDSFIKSDPFNIKILKQSKIDINKDIRNKYYDLDLGSDLGTI